MNPSQFETQILELIFNRIEAHPILALIGLLLVIYLIYINFFKSNIDKKSKDKELQDDKEEQDDEIAHCDVCNSCNDIIEFEVDEDSDLNEDWESIYICKSCIDKAYPRETFHKELIEELNEKDYNINDNYFEGT